MKQFILESNARKLRLDILPNNEVLLNDNVLHVDLVAGGSIHTLRIGNKTFHVYIKSISELEYEVWIKQYVVQIKLETQTTIYIRRFNTFQTNISHDSQIKAPMPGLIKDIEVREGQVVQQGEGLLILEAMKMENEIHSPVRGKIKSIFVQRQNTVEKNQLLLTIDPIENE